MKEKAVANRKNKRRGMSFEGRPVLEPNACGIDVGARQTWKD